MSLATSLASKVAEKGQGKSSPKLSKKAWAKLADALGIDESKRDEAESALRLYMHLSKEEDD